MPSPTSAAGRAAALAIAAPARTSSTSDAAPSSTTSTSLPDYPAPTQPDYLTDALAPGPPGPTHGRVERLQQRIADHVAGEHCQRQGAGRAQNQVRVAAPRRVRAGQDHCTPARDRGLHADPDEREGGL